MSQIFDGSKNSTRNYVAHWKFKERPEKAVKRGLKAIVDEDGNLQNCIIISKKDENGNITSWCQRPELVSSFRDSDGNYRSCHAVLYDLVNGKFPDKDSCLSWIGWSSKPEGIEFFSCTLNTKNGWKSDRNKDKEKNTLDDLVAETKIGKLIDHIHK